MVNHSTSPNMRLVERSLDEQARLVRLGELHAACVTPLWLQTTARVKKKTELACNYHAGIDASDPLACSFSKDL